jgi:hypothetical protein
MGRDGPENEMIPIGKGFGGSGGVNVMLLVSVFPSAPVAVSVYVC